MQKVEGKTDTIKIFNDIDSIAVTGLFFGKHSKSFTLHFYEGNLVGAFHHGKEEKFTIHSLDKKNKFINYINRFYIEKSDSIVLSERSEPAPVTDYPFIRVKGFKGEKEVLNKDVTLYSNIEFHPQFIEFYEFLDSLVKEE